MFWSLITFWHRLQVLHFNKHHFSISRDTIGLHWVTTKERFETSILPGIYCENVWLPDINPSKRQLVCVSGDIFRWKTGWIWMHCWGAPPRYCATTNRSVETMHYKLAQLHLKALLAASILSAFRFQSPHRSYSSYSILLWRFHIFVGNVQLFVLNILVCFCSPHVWVMPIRDCGRQNVNVPIYPVLGMTRNIAVVFSKIPP